MSRRPAPPLTLESLEDRLALSSTPAANPLESLVTVKGGGLLGVIDSEYTNYHQAGSQGPFLSAQSSKVEMAGPTVGVGAGNFLSNAADMKAVGMVVTKNIPSSGLIEGFMPLWQLPAVAVAPNLASLAPVLKPSSGPILPSATTPADSTLALKGAQTLDSIYQQFLAYEAAGRRGTFTPTQSSSIVMAGGAVGVQITTSASNLNTLIARMDELGMLVTASTTVGQVGVIDGFLDIANLPAAANAGLIGISPIHKQVSF